MDFDRVDESNLQRQILHGTSDVGELKTESARRRLQDLNPFVTVETYEERLTSENAMTLIEKYDVVVDGTDNFPTRYLVNDACVFLGKPNVYGSIFRFEGQVSLFHTKGGGPCYRCLYPEPPPPHLVPSCAEGGVLGILPGVIGSLQATEVVKFLLGVGQGLLGRLLCFDALAMSFREMKIRKAPNCPVCGPEPSITKLVDYGQFCGMDPEEYPHPEVTPTEFLRRWENGERPRLIDVRDAHEWSIANLEEYGAALMPLSRLKEQVEALNRSEAIVVHCKTGGRSRKAQSQLLQMGFTDIRNLSGGLQRWSDEVDSSKLKY